MPVVNIAVCGKFHYAHYVRFIEERGMLGNFYFSHRRSTGADTLQIPPTKAHNLYLKEYLAFAHRKFFRNLDYLKWITRYQDVWQWQLLKQWQRCDIFHTINHGAGIKVSERAKREGSIIIGEPVNSHPENMFRLIGGEHERLGIPYADVLPPTFKRMMDEEAFFDYYLSPSSFVTQSYRERGIDAKRIFTVPFGVNLTNFGLREVPKEKFRVIYVAQITPRKAHIDLLRAWEMLGLPESEAELVLVGHIDPVMKPFFDKNRHRFTYLGTIPNQELVNYYNSSSVFVMPSVEEGCSYAPLEAMACGIPVILTANTGSGELVTHGEQGFIVPIRSPEKIAYYLERLYRDRDLRLAMGKKAFEKSRESFGWDTYAQKIIEIYNRVTE